MSLIKVRDSTANLKRWARKAWKEITYTSMEEIHKLLRDSERDRGVNPYDASVEGYKNYLAYRYQQSQSAKER